MDLKCSAKHSRLQSLGRKNSLSSGFLPNQESPEKETSSQNKIKGVGDCCLGCVWWCRIAGAKPLDNNRVAEEKGKIQKCRTAVMEEIVQIALQRRAGIGSVKTQRLLAMWLCRTDAEQQAEIVNCHSCRKESSNA